MKIKSISMKNYTTKALILLAVSLFVFSSCKKDDPEPPVEEEVITTVNFTMTPMTGSAVTMTFLDLDGDGGTAPVITGGTLAANTSYAGSLELLNESETPSEDITAEIAEEDEEHQFFFSTDIAGLSVAYSDADMNGNPIGLATTVTTGAAGSGTLTVILRHEPNKDASGVDGGDITNAGGSTDVEIDFPVTVK